MRLLTYRFSYWLGVEVDVLTLYVKVPLAIFMRCLDE